NLAWGAATDTVGVTGYHVERCQGAGCTNFVEIATTPNTSYSDSGLTAGTTYTYRVRANDAAANLGPYSNSAGATTSSGGGGGPTLVAAYGFEEGSGTATADGSRRGGTRLARTGYCGRAARCATGLERDGEESCHARRL